MDNKNLDSDSTDNSANFTNSVEALRKFGNIAGDGKDGLTIEEKAIMEYYAEIERKEKRTKKQVKAIETVTNDLLHFAGSLSSGGADGFSGLTAAIDATVGIAAGFASAVPFVGEQLKEMAEVIGDLSKFLVNQFKSAYGKFEKLSDTGVVTTFEDLKEISDSTGLNLEDINKVFGKFSRDMAVFGGSATTGRKSIQELLFDSDKISRNFQNLGMSIDQVAEFQISALAQSKLSSDFDINDTKKNVSFTSQYILSIDTLSKLTGKGRKELQEEILARGASARYTAGIGTLPKEIKQQADAAISLLSVIGPKTFGEGISDIIATNGAPITEKSRLAFMNLEEGGMNVRDSVLKLKRGEMSGIEFNNMARKAMARFAQSNKEQIKVSASGLKVYENITAGFDALINAEEDSNKTAEELTAAQNAIINATKGTGESLSETQRSMYAISKNLTMLIASSDIVAGAMNTVADAMNKTTEKMYKLIGKELPEELKARFEETSSLTKLNEEKSKLNKLTVQLTFNTQKLIKLKENPKSDPGEMRKLRVQNEKDIKEKTLLETQIQARQQQLDIIKKDRIEKENMAKYGQKTNPNSPAGGNTAGGNTAGGNTAGGNTAGGNTAGGNTAGGNTAGGNTAGGNTAGGNTAGGNTAGASVGTSAGPNAKAVGSWKDDTEFLAAVNDYARRMNFKAEDLLGVMASESGIRADIGNSNGGAVGLIQFMPATAAALNTSSGELAKMTRAQQMKYVEAFFKMVNLKPGSTGAQMYGKVFLPGRSHLDILTKRGENYYEANKGLDIGNKGYINQADLQQKVDRKKSEFGITSIASSNQPATSATVSTPSAQSASVGPKQARTGGILSGPSTGYTAILHGDEIVIPANEGSQKLQLQKMMGDSLDQESVVKLFNMISKNIDMMISSVETSISNQMTYKNMRVA